MLKFYSIAVVIVLFVCQSWADDFPASTIERCKVEDDVCIAKTWNKWMHIAEKNGIPELDLPISETFFVDKQEITIGSNLMTLKLTFHNSTVSGMAGSIVDRIKGFKKDPKEMKHFEIFGVTPHLRVVGKYVGSGKLLLLQVGGTGNGKFDFYDTKFKITIQTKTEVKGGEEYLVPTKVQADFALEKMNINFDNILNNKEITDSINKMVNENPDLFAKEIKYTSEVSFARVMKEILTPIMKRYPYRSFFAE